MSNQNNHLPLVKTVLLGGILLMPMSLIQAARAERPLQLAQTAPAQDTCVQPGPNGTCIPDKIKDKKSPQSETMIQTQTLSNGNGQTSEAGNPCKPGGSSTDCLKWINKGYKPKPRPK